MAANSTSKSAPKKQVRPEYSSWSAMKTRCCDDRHRAYPWYGGRGITVCDRWLHGEGGKTGFACFVADMGLRPLGTTLDRRDSDKNYEPGNCRWLDARKQSLNTRANVRVTIGGETKSVIEWARERGVDDKTIYARIDRGWPAEKLFDAIAPRPKNRQIVINGEAKTMKEWARIAGIAYGTMRRRVSEGLTGPDLLAPLPPPPMKITINGETKTVREWAEVTGLLEGTIRDRLALGWSGAKLLAAASHVAWSKGRR